MPARLQGGRPTKRAVAAHQYVRRRRERGSPTRLLEAGQLLEARQRLAHKR